MEVLGVNLPGWFITFIFIYIILLALYLYSKWKHSLWKNLGIPGPKPLPFLGIFPSYFKKGICNTDLELVEKYGDVVGIYHGHDKALLISDPDMLKQIFIKEFSTFPQRSLFFERTEISECSLANCSKDPWKFMRTTISPSFTNSRLKQMTEKIQACCDCLIDRFKEQSVAGEPFNVVPFFQSYAVNVISSTAFGVEISNKEINDMFVYYGEKSAVGKLPANLGIFICMFPFLKKWIKIYHLPNDVIRFFTSVVKKAVAMKEENLEKRKDFLQLMLNARHEDNIRDLKNGRKELSEKELVFNSVTFYIAGMGTVSLLMSYCCYVLATHPEIQKEIAGEIESVLQGVVPNHEVLSKMPYLDRFVSEVLRLYPPGPRLSRENIEDITIKGIFIPKMTHIAISPFAMHRDPKYWPNPEKFDPDRFTDEQKSKRPECTYMPFGLGPRICVGMRLAQMVAKMGLIRLVQEFEFSKCEKTEIPPSFDHGIVLSPKNGLILNVVSRKQ